MNKLTSLPLVEQLSSRVIRILGCNPGIKTLQGTNTYLIGNGKKRILIDSAGMENVDDYVKLLANEMRQRNISLQEILITHWHPDHSGGVQTIFKTITNNAIKVSKHKLETQPEIDTETKYNYIKDGDIFETEGATIQTLFTPGHTSDHLSFYLKEENALFSGDCILGETTAVFEDLFSYMNSLRNILSFRPETIYPGHGPVIKDGVERIEYFIAHRNKRNEQILKALKEIGEPLDELQIVKIVYVGLNENLISAACENVTNHLNALNKQSLVEKTDSGKWILANNQ